MLRHLGFIFSSFLVLLPLPLTSRMNHVTYVNHVVIMYSTNTWSKKWFGTVFRFSYDSRVKTPVIFGFWGVRQSQVVDNNNVNTRNDDLLFRVIFFCILAEVKHGHSIVTNAATIFSWKLKRHTYKRDKNSNNDCLHFDLLNCEKLTKEAFSASVKINFIWPSILFNCSINITTYMVKIH